MVRGRCTLQITDLSKEQNKREKKKIGHKRGEMQWQRNKDYMTINTQTIPDNANLRIF